MELSPLILKWLTFLLRWGHVFFAITWIGNSFLFNYLDNKLKKNLENSDIFILPSLKEGLSIALVEAMCMETLCLVSKPSNHSKIIINNKNGYEFELNEESFSRIFKKINTLRFKNKEKIIKNAKKTVKKLISKNIIFEKKIIDTLLSNHQ